MLLEIGFGNMQINLLNTFLCFLRKKNPPLTPPRRGIVRSKNQKRRFKTIIAEYSSDIRFYICLSNYLVRRSRNHKEEVRSTKHEVRFNRSTELTTKSQISNRTSSFVLFLFLTVHKNFVKKKFLRVNTIKSSWRYPL